MFKTQLAVVLSVASLATGIACKGGSAPASAGAPAAAPSAAKPAADVLTIKNETGVTLNELLIMPSEEEKWGDANLLASAPIPNGATGTVKKSAFPKKGPYDLSFTGADDSDYYVWDLDVAANDTVTVTKANADKKK